MDSLRLQSLDPSRFEVIIADDMSTDRTWEILNSAEPTAFGLTKIQVTDPALSSEKMGSSKKRAIKEAIAVSKGSVIVTTDADCTFHPEWLRTISSYYEKYDVNCVAAPVQIDYQDQFTGVFEALDFITLQGITAGALSKQLHVLANGANLSYRKAAYEKVNGFDGIDSGASGDDILLMQKFADLDPAKITYLKSREAVVKTDSAKRPIEFLNQRIRWAGKTGQYRDKRLNVILTLVWCFNLCFLILPVMVFFENYYVFLFLLFFLAKILVEFPLVNAVAGFFGERKLMLLFPVLQPLHIVYTVAMGLLGKFGKFTWKGRRYSVQ